MSKDENLTKAHVRYLENRLLAEAAQIKRFTLDQNQSSGSKLPESDREDMEVFLAHIRQLLPVLGSDILAPIAQRATKGLPGGVLYCRIKNAEARGQRTATGFVVYQGSSAVLYSAVRRGLAVSPKAPNISVDGKRGQVYISLISMKRK